MTGGLGVLMVPHEFEVWLCVDLHAYSSCSTQIDPFCFTYSEVDGVFVPWATNSSLRLEKMASTRRMIPNRNRHYSKLSPTHHITEASAPFQGKDERAEKKPKSVEERLEHLESIKKYLPEAKYNQKIDEILKLTL